MKETERLIDEITERAHDRVTALFDDFDNAFNGAPPRGIAGVILCARAEPDDRAGGTAHTTAYSARGADDLLAGGIAKLFEDRPDLYERVEATLHWRRVRRMRREWL